MINMYTLFRVSWDVASCSHVEVDRCFRGAYCLHPQGGDDDDDDGDSTHVWNVGLLGVYTVLYQKTLNLIFAAVRTRNLVYTRYRFWLPGLYCRVVLKVGSKVTEGNGAPVFILYPQKQRRHINPNFREAPTWLHGAEALYTVDCRL
jgi:hypothetical protein